MVLFFCKFLSDKIDTSFRESKAKISKRLDQLFFMETFFKNGFEAALWSKANVFSIC